MTITAATPITTAQRATLPEAAAPAKADVARAGIEFSAALSAAGETAAATAPIIGKGAQSGRLGELQQFEGFVLRTFVESMLPAENSSFFGSGTAGDIWRSMLAERLGDEIAASGGVGIAELLAGTDGVGQAGDRLAAEGDAGLAGSAAVTRMR